MAVRLRCWSYLTVIAAILATAQAASASHTRLNVAVAISPVTPYIAAILGDAGDAHNLLHPGQEAHEFSLSPSQIQLLEQADVLVIPDLSMSPMLTRLLKNYPKIKVIELSKLQGADALTYVSENPWLEKHKTHDAESAESQTPNTDALYPKKLPGLDEKYPIGHDDTATSHTDNPLYTKKLAGFDEKPHKPTPPLITDPHLWLDPERMAAMAQPMAEAFGTVDPANRNAYTANAQREAAHLRQEVLPGMQTLLTPTHEPVAPDSKPPVPFITYHAAYQYFLQRFSLPHTGEIFAHPEDYMGAKTMTQLLESAKVNRIRCIIGEADTPMVQRIAKASGARVVVLSPEQLPVEKGAPKLGWVKNGYDQLLYDTAQQFGKCL